jgi:hypothetical protein
MAFANGTSATLFFRTRFDNGVAGASAHVSVGLSDQASPSGFSHYEAQLRILDSDDNNSFDARDSTVFEELEEDPGDNTVGVLDESEWFLNWMAIDNTTDTWTYYIQNEDGTGQFPVQTQLTVPDGTINFRNGVAANDLETFFLMNAFNHGEDFYIDDIYADTTSSQPSLANPLPEPSTALLLGAGLIAMSATRRRSRIRVA